MSADGTKAVEVADGRITADDLRATDKRTTRVAEELEQHISEHSLVHGEWHKEMSVLHKSVHEISASLTKLHAKSDGRDELLLKAIRRPVVMTGLVCAGFGLTWVTMLILVWQFSNGHG